MSTQLTQRTMDRYFELMGRGADFAECYAADATWLIADTGEVVSGSGDVRDYVIALHATFVDSRTRTYLVGEEHVYLEGDCEAIPPEAGGRTCYCVAYDLVDGVITAMRCYGLGARAVAGVAPPQGA